ncbi:GntR family transcriptional regulator [Novosphingobium guangzhouense]|uniref:HTH gntR-type domain-containing protein n=1 Tax=Novosphingobium guangzhouense TaxID=1850347 RepID=A0A2K2G6M0_9SPHN|nr:GntR family transcriptional regulator [Novosphingobium guangzhouense]PNU06669.1 hypothetical protein A8V01_00275 [Novosphingobium guangzhouense]
MSKAGERAYNAIRDQILDGTLAPGSQVREEDIAHACATSRTPVREAIRRLEGEKLIERDRQRSYVRVWSEAAMRDVFALRLMVEPYVAGQAARLIQPESVDVLRRANDIYRRELAMARPDISVIVTQNNLFHETLLDATGSDVLQMILPRLIAVPIVPLSLRRYDRPQLEKALEEHDELVMALEARDPEWASMIMTGHIHRARRVFFET